MITSSRSFVSPTLFGRVDALAALHATLNEAREDKGQIVLLVGEAGMGKSRLAREAIAAAREQAMVVTVGQCCESEQAFPYAPLREMLSHLHSETADPGVDPLSEARTDAIRAFSMPAEAILGTDATNARYRLFRSLSDLLIAQAHRKPLLLVLEDAQWCDDGTLEFLGGFARHLGDLSVCLLLTYRDDALSPALQHTLTLFDRTRLTTEIHVSSLDARDVERMIRAIFDLRRPVQREFVEALTHLTGGNPFFIEEMLKSLMAGGDLLFADVARNSNLLADLRVPRTVDETVQRRLPLLSPAAQRLLTVLAVAGRPAEMDLLQAVVAVDETALATLIAEGVAAQFILEAGDDTVAFRHDLTRQAVYGAVSEHERRHWHHVIATCMENYIPATPNVRMLDLARHWYLAQRWDKALDTNWRAGMLAQAWYAPQGASSHFTYALEAVSRLNRTPPVELLRARAQALLTLGALESARNDFEAILQLTNSPTRGDHGHDVEQQWQALLDLGFSWDGINYDKTRHYYERAFDLARTSGSQLLIARSGNRIGNWHMNMEQPEEGLRYHQQALAIFIQTDATEDIIETHILIAYSGVFIGDLTLALDHFRRAIALARQYDNRQSLSAALGASALCSPTHSTDTMLATLSLDEASRNVEEAMQLARAIGWRLNEAITSGWRAGIATSRGEYGTAVRYAEEGVAIAEEMEHPEWQSLNLYQLGVVACDTFAYETAQSYLERALVLAEEIRSLHLRRIISGRLAQALALSGQNERARMTLNKVMSADEPMLTPGQRECWCGYATVALAEGNPSEALAIIHRLVAAAHAPAMREIPRLALLGGEALLVLGRPEATAALLRDAYHLAYTQGWNTLVWRLEELWGQALHTQGVTDEAAQVRTEARALAETLATSILGESERVAFLHAIMTTYPTATPSLSPRRSRAVDELTPREREVALLVARGRTNRQIAHDLVISEETATVHVKHILHKLQFTSRSQIAAWVVDHRLDPSENY